MFRGLGFGFLCCLAIGAGVAAVSVPLEGKTASEHIRGLFDQGQKPRQPAAAPAKSAGKPKDERPAAGPAKAEAAARPARPPENEPTDSERKALEDLLGGKVK